MRKIFIVIAALLSFGAANAQKATVSGSIKGVDNGSAKIVVSTVNGNKVIPTDTVDIDKKGNYKFEVDNPSPTLFLLNITGINQSPLHLMLMPNDKVTMDIENDAEIGFVHIVSTKGSKELDVYRQFNTLMYNFTKQAQAIDNEYSNQSTSEQRKQQLGDQFLELQTSQNVGVKKLLEQNSDALISAFLVTYFDKDIETYYDLFEQVYNTLKTKYTDNQFVKYVESKLKSSLGPGRMAPEITMKDPDGKERKLSDLRGKVVLIDFWASWCRPCRMENPNVVKIYKKYHDKGFDIFSVSLDKTKNDWIKAIAQDGLEWENHVSDLNGWTSSGGAAYGITSVPSTVLVDRQGRIIARNLRGQQLEMKLKEIFGE